MEEETKKKKKFCGFQNRNFRYQILDEISLEGLDGITLQALWLRLQAREDFSLGVEGSSKDFIWEVIKCLEEVILFKLEEPRQDLVIHDRYKYRNGELGIVVEPNVIPQDIYPFSLVDDENVSGNKGSCQSFNTRSIIDDDLSLGDAEKLGNSLVIVSSQIARYRSVLGNDYDPLLASNITAMQWALLERIGRARYQGEITQGNLSLQFTNENPKTLFYHRKLLVAKGLLTKQVHHQKTTKQLANMKTVSQNSQGSLFHLPRFYVERQPKTLVLVKRMIEVLKQHPKYLATYEEMKAVLKIGSSFKKLLKTREFMNFMQADVKVPYRVLHPDAAPHEWKRKGMQEEKMIRVVKLKNVDTTPDQVFNNSPEKLDSTEVEDEFVQADVPYGVLDQSNWILDRSVMWQAYQAVESAGPEGISQQGLGQKLGQGKLEARTICRNLLRRDLVITVLDDRGRQRVTNFVAKKFEAESRFSSRFQEEKLKNEALTAKKEADTPVIVRKEEQSDSEKKPQNTEETKAPEIDCDALLPTSKHYDHYLEELLKDPDEETQQQQQKNQTKQPKNQPQAQKSVQNSRSKKPTTSTPIPKRRMSGRLEKKMKKNKINDENDATNSTDTLDTTNNDTTLFDQTDDTIKADDSKMMDDSITTEKDDTLQNMDISGNGADEESKISMSIKSDYQLNDMCKSPKKKNKKDFSQSSLRQLKRINTIIEAVRQFKVIDDPTKLYKMIQENEVKEGYNAKMDKKSLLRILSKLGRDGQIKNITVQLELNDKTKNLHFVCEPDIDESNTVIQSAIEQAKMKFNSYRLSPDPELRELIQKKIDEGEFIKEDTPYSSASTPPPLDSDTQSAPATPITRSKSSAFDKKRYGLQPKFIRMREVHLLFFYLCRDYTGDVNLDQFKALHKLQDDGFLDTEDIREVSKCQIYSTSVDWKMFIPPLPSHAGWSEGWFLMCDVLLRLPLSVFVKLVHITMQIQGLQEYLAHPVKKHMLIRNLPSPIRTKLMHQRKYIFTIHEVATRLAFIGIIQFGPQKLKEKDQVFVYVNTKATLLDTTSSMSGYHQVESGRPYPEKKYKFSCVSHLELYWYDMWEICVNTPLGESLILTGQEITLEVMDKKPEMLAALEPCQSDQAAAKDTGVVPGDGVGAAGLDSSMFAHLKRNWSWNSTSSSASKGKRGSSSSSKHQLKPPSCVKLLQDQEGDQTESTSSDLPVISTTLKVTKEPGSKAKENRKRKRSGQNAEPSKVVIKEAPTGRPIKFTRVVGKRKQVERKPYYDEKDKQALRLMRKLRVDWSSREDSFLLLCKAAGMFLCSGTKNQMVSYTSVRDLIHKYFPVESSNKTSRACQRRLNYMIKNETTMDNVTLFLADLQQDQNLTRFTQEPDPNESKVESDARLEKEFAELVDILITKRENANSQPQLQLPHTLQEVFARYNIVNPAEVIGPKRTFQEPQKVEDIHCGVLNTLVVSSLCSASDKRSWTFQLFKIYQQYPDTLLRAVMADLRQKKMVSLKKQYNKSKIKKENYLPLSSSPYQLSVTFSHSFLNRYQYDIYSQSWQMLKTFLSNSNEFTEILIGQEGGYAATVTSLLAADRLSFRTEVPEQLVVLDPNLSAGNEQYVRILERYKELLRNAGANTNQTDIDLMAPSTSERKGSNKVTCTTLFKEKNSRSKSSKTDAKHASPSIEDENGQDKTTAEKRVTGENNQIVFQEGSDARSNTALAKSASRIALYMMREEIRESPLDNGDPVQHSHDFFVISTCKLEGRVNCPAAAEDERLVSYSDIKNIPISWLPGDVTANEELIRKYNGQGSKCSFNVLERIPYIPLELDVEHHLKDVDCEVVELCRQVLHLVEADRELGVEKDVLRDTVTMRRQQLIDTLCFLTERKIIIPVGIKNQRYVSHKYCRDWLIHTYKINRGGQEKISTSKFSGKLYQGNGPSEPLPAVRGKRRRSSLDSATGGEDISVHQKSRNIQVNHEVSEASQKINWDEMEEILVQIRPWIRIDGSLNRRVLDRLLGAVLGAVMQNPGSLLCSLTTRFSPALQPVHARELIHTLQHIKAVNLISMKKPKKPSLWSKPEEVKLGPADILHSDDEVIVEASVDAILILGQFIGNKQYTTDFVCHCPCHPDRRM